jgi:hypothetical protein
MDNPHLIDRPDLVKLLEAFGKEVSRGKEEYYTPIVTVTSSEGSLIEFTLYLLAHQISYEYRAINVEVHNQVLHIRFYTLATKQSENYQVDISNGTSSFTVQLNKIGNLGLFKAALEFLVNQTELKREYRSSPILSQIVIGQARVAVLYNGDKINVGWKKIEGDEVVYYTGQGLYNIWRPNMTEEEQKKAENYKKLSDSELKQLGYLDKRKISEFKSLE